VLVFANFLAQFWFLFWTKSCESMESREGTECLAITVFAFTLEPDSRLEVNLSPKWKRLPSFPEKSANPFLGYIQVGLGG
jgi:hypothetical protein